MWMIGAAAIAWIQQSWSRKWVNGEQNGGMRYLHKIAILIEFSVIAT